MKNRNCDLHKRRVRSFFNWGQRREDVKKVDELTEDQLKWEKTTATFPAKGPALSPVGLNKGLETKRKRKSKKPPRRSLPRKQLLLILKDPFRNWTDMFLKCIMKRRKQINSQGPARRSENMFQGNMIKLRFGIDDGRECRYRFW